MIAIGVIFVTLIKLPLIFGDSADCPCSGGLTEALDLIADLIASPSESVESCTEPIEDTEFQFTNWNAKATYAVGDTVTLICKPGAKPNAGGQTTQTITCLHGNQWSRVIGCQTICPNGFTLYGSICYYIGTNAVSFEQAMVDCAKLNAGSGSRLLIASTAEKQKDLMAMARESGFFSTNPKSLWIGATDKLDENNFLWNDGKQMNFLTPEFVFFPGEPNDMVSIVPGDEDCLILWSTGAIADNFCHASGVPSYAICEIPF